MSNDTETEKPSNFIRDIVREDLASGKHSAIQTRFPPEPNGYLHIGHAKAICLDFGLAEEFNGQCNLRFDDTNPEKESEEYVRAIQEDIRWLGFEWNKLCFSSDYFETLYQWAEHLIQNGKAYVCDLSKEQMAELKGDEKTPDRPSPNRDRPADESLDLFRRMRAGEFPDGAYVLRAKIDLAASNFHLRDPALYRIRHVHHHRTGNEWCIYPTYDYTHGQSDALEFVTHSLCTLEFEVHRPLYEWLVDNLPVPHRPRQIEFARLNLTYTVMSKRKLLQLVEEGTVAGWDDPRMPTISGLRRRGYTPEAIRNFCERIGITKFVSQTDIGLLEYFVRDHLNKVATRRMAVFDPLKVVITNIPEGAEPLMLDIINSPEDETAGTRAVPFTRELYIQQEDFKENANKKFFRLTVGKEVRLRGSYVIKCEEAIKDAGGNITELRCTADLDTLGKNPEGRKVKGVIHWVSASHAVEVPVRIYDRLFSVEQPDGDKERPFTDFLNPESLAVTTALVEPALAEAKPEEHFQFERVGYFIADRHDSQPGKPAFNRTVPLKDSWGKQ